jgi:hypothetical protein
MIPEKKAVGNATFHLPLIRRDEKMPEITSRYQIPERSNKYPDTRHTTTPRSIDVKRDNFMFYLQGEE